MYSLLVQGSLQLKRSSFENGGSFEIEERGRRVSPGQNDRLDGKCLQSNDVIGRAGRSDLAPSCSVSPPVDHELAIEHIVLWGWLGYLCRRDAVLPYPGC